MTEYCVSYWLPNGFEQDHYTDTLDEARRAAVEHITEGATRVEITVWDDLSNAWLIPS